MVVIRTFLNSVDAELAKSALEAADINAEVHADDCGGVWPYLSKGGVELLVDDADEAQAMEVLEAEPSEPRD